MTHSDVRQKDNRRRSPSSPSTLAKKLADLVALDATELKRAWQDLNMGQPPKHMNKDILRRAIAYELQEKFLGGLNATTKRKLARLSQQYKMKGSITLPSRAIIKPGTKLIREWQGNTYSVIVLEEGFEFEGKRYRSLSAIAQKITGARWSGPRFFGIKT